MNYVKKQNHIYQSKQFQNSGIHGITLVSLVVTIVIILILASVSINMVLGNNGLMKKAKEAKNVYMQDAINTEKGFSELYDELQLNLGEFPSTEYTTPYLPTGFSRVEGTGLSNGLVIQDGSQNQYVWVEVPRTTEVYTTAGLSLDFNTLSGNDLETAYAKIENDLHTYTSVYRNGTTYSDTFYPDTANEDWFTEEEYYNAKKKMLKSVYENGGFYVGRYETGIATTENPRTASGDTLQTPVIIANAYPYNFISITQAKILAENMASGNNTSSLMFGVQWDLTLKYLETKGTIQAELANLNGSTNWGNYKESKFDILNTKAKYSTDSGESWLLVPTDGYEKTDYSPVLLTTGANEARNSKQNICDLAGNVFEWTLENTNKSNSPYSTRGGSFGYSAYNTSASCRDFNYTDEIHSRTGFRVSIY